MSDISKQRNEIRQLNQLQQRDQWMNQRHPLVKLSLTILYILFVVSCQKYQLSAMIGFAVYPLFMFSLADLSLKDALHRMRLILLLVLAVGIFNPLFDRQILLTMGGIPVTGGVISMLTLMLKGLYTVLAAYVLMATTKMEEICAALRMLHVPKILVTVVLLIDRYFYMLAEEAERIMTAYRLRAPSQKGIHYKAWGPLVGQWLIRSMDRAQLVYESMTLRGFHGEFPDATGRKVAAGEIAFLIGWCLFFFANRCLGLPDLIGRVLMG